MEFLARQGPGEIHGDDGGIRPMLQLENDGPRVLVAGGGASDRPGGGKEGLNRAGGGTEKSGGAC